MDSRKDEDGSPVVVRPGLDIGVGKEEDGEYDGDAVVLGEDEPASSRRKKLGSVPKSRRERGGVRGN